jgi:hypothetical protein
MTKIKIRTQIEILKSGGRKRKLDCSDSQVFLSETEPDQELKRLLKRAFNSIPISEDLTQRISERIKQV